MDEQKIISIFQSLISQYASQSQFGPGPVRDHSHNDIDSKSFSVGNLDFSNFMIWGNGETDGSGSLIIVNQNILSTSTVLALGGNGANTNALAGSCTNGQASIGTQAAGTTIHYLIIF